MDVMTDCMSSWDKDKITAFLETEADNEQNWETFRLQIYIWKTFLL